MMIIMKSNATPQEVEHVIEPRETRPRLINALEMLSNKRDTNPAKKHGNIPL